jgi:hypothetical protein
MNRWASTENDKKWINDPLPILPPPTQKCHNGSTIRHRAALVPFLFHILFRQLSTSPPLYLYLTVRSYQIFLFLFHTLFWQLFISSPRYLYLTGRWYIWPYSYSTYYSESSPPLLRCTFILQWGHIWPSYSYSTHSSKSSPPLLLYTYGGQKGDVQRVSTWPNYAWNHVEWSHASPLLHPSHFKPSLLAAFRVDGPGWITSRRSYHTLIWEQMPDNVHRHL